LSVEDDFAGTDFLPELVLSDLNELVCVIYDEGDGPVFARTVDPALTPIDNWPVDESAEGDGWKWMTIVLKVIHGNLRAK
jgi:hypothetical protein